MLTADSVSYRYADRQPWVLQSVSLTIEPGEIVGLSGPSGQGKTTLARLLAGYLTPNAGRITLDGAPLPRRGISPVQLVFQHPELAVNPRWRIARVLTEGEPAAPALLERLGVGGSWLGRWPHELSGGELQRVAVARALGHHTRYLIADEMTAMLDALTQAQIWQAVLSHVNGTGLGVLVISHSAAVLERLCGRVVTLADASVPRSGIYSQEPVD